MTTENKDPRDSAHHLAMMEQMDVYIAENRKFVEKGVKASATRARKALQAIAVALKERRKEITEEKNAL
jgi:hypothetical protein